MKTVFRLMALGLFVCGSCIMAGCGAEATTETTTDAPAETSNTSSTDEAPAETAAVTPKTTSESGDLALVSLKVPNMT